MTKPVDKEQIRDRHLVVTGRYVTLSDSIDAHSDRATLLNLVDTQAAEIKRLRDCAADVIAGWTLEGTGFDAELTALEAALKEHDNETL